MFVHPAVRAVLIPWAGVPEKTLALARLHPQVSLHNLHHNAPQVAELAVALLFAATKEVLRYDRGLRAGDWRPRSAPTRSVLLEGKTAVILGYGTIGRRAGRILKALGMHIIGINRTGNRAEHGPADEVHPIEALPENLPRAEVLFSTLPLTDSTRGLLGKEELALLPQNAWIVNVGRGSVFDEESLYEGLSSGRIAGAGLDVWWTYPKDEAARPHTFPSSFPFHELNNVVMSPHRAGSVVERGAGWASALAGMLNAYASGRPMPNRVDLESGY